MKKRTKDRRCRPRKIWISDELWGAADRAAAQEGLTLSQWVRDSLADRIGRPELAHVLPAGRPPKEKG